MPEPTITGEALYALLLAVQPDLAYTWRDLNTFDKQVYVEVATILNGTYLAPLQGELERQINNACEAYDVATKQQQQNDALRALLRDYQVFMAPLRLMSHEKRFAKVRDLFERSFQLLGEEQKVKE